MIAERPVASWIGTCVGLATEDLEAFDNSSRNITYATFRRHLGREHVAEIETYFGYGKWLRMKDDWSVSYSIGKWKGTKAVCLFHSGIHHIWTIE